ncbi:MAG: DUF4136 domain-containing protein [Gemmatimonadetes bacterium]|nr:DUF4136 domain-containing protein [Gemmatimonadota bacterium]
MISQNVISCLATAAFLAGCGGGLKVDTDYDPQADFASMRTYQWAQRTPSGDDDPRVYNAIVMGRLKTAVNTVLQAKGFREVSSSPDVYVAWHAAIEGKMSYETINNNYGYGWGRYGGGGWGMGTSTSRTTTREWDEGMLLIDFIDAGSEELVYRTVGQAKLSQSRRTPQEAQERANEVVAEMLADFPPGRGTD